MGIKGITAVQEGKQDVIWG